MGGRGGMNPERRLEMMQRQLNLTPEQTSQVKALFETERSKMEALRSSGDAGQDRRGAMMAIHQDEETKLMGILNPDQQAKYKAMQERMRERRQDGGTPPPPPPPQQ
jgi:protein CpxP